MNVLVFHQYYVTPEQPGSTRMFYFIQKLLDHGHHVTLVTGGRARKHNSNKHVMSWQQEVHFTIISVRDDYKQDSGFLGRLSAFLRYSIYSTFLGIRMKSIHIVFASSTPLTIGIPAITLSKLKKTPYVFEVRDLWPDAPIALGFLQNPWLQNIAYSFEKMAYRNSIVIIALTQGLGRKISQRSSTPVYFIPNSVDDVYRGVIVLLFLSMRLSMISTHPPS